MGDLAAGSVSPTTREIAWPRALLPADGLPAAGVQLYAHRPVRGGQSLDSPSEIAASLPVLGALPSQTGPSQAPRKYLSTVEPDRAKAQLIGEKVCKSHAEP